MTIDRDKFVEFITFVPDGSQGKPSPIPTPTPTPSDIPAIITEAGEMLATEAGEIIIWGRP